MSDSNGTRERIHFVEVEIQNHMRVLRAHVFLPGSGVVPVSGSNRAGKTSFKRSLAALIGGDAEVEDAPRHRDAPDDEEAYIVGTLSNGTKLRRSFTGAASSPKGRLTAKDSEDRQLSQRHLSALVGPRALRPMTFLEGKGRAADAQRRDTLMGFSPGLSDTLSELNARRAALEEERRPHNSQIQALGRLPKPEGERPEPIDVSGEMEKLRGLQAEQRNRSESELAVNRAERHADEAAGSVQEAERIVVLIEQELREAKDSLTEKVVALANAKDAVDEARSTLQGVEDPSDAIDSVTAKISRADAVNESLEPWKEWERAQEKLAQHRGERDILNDALTTVEEAKRDALAGASLPFTALSFDDDGEVLVDGSPLSAASGMEQCRLALEVAIADDPELGVVFMNGNELDDQALEEIHRLAEAHDFQVIMDIIHSPGFDGEVRMADGVATQGVASDA